MHKKPQYFEVRTDDNRLFCKAKLVEGDIILILRSAGKEMEIYYSDIPRLILIAKQKHHGLKPK